MLKLSIGVTVSQDLLKYLKACEQRTENKKKLAINQWKLCKTKTDYQCVRSLNEINHSLGWGGLIETGLRNMQIG